MIHLQRQIIEAESQRMDYFKQKKKLVQNAELIKNAAAMEEKKTSEE